MRRMFVIYDERAILEGTMEASVLCTARTLEEARRDVRTMFPRGVIYQYDIQPKVTNDPLVLQLVNETFIEGPK